MHLRTSAAPENGTKGKQPDMIDHQTNTQGRGRDIHCPPGSSRNNRVVPSHGAFGLFWDFSQGSEAPWCLYTRKTSGVQRNMDPTYDVNATPSCGSLMDCSFLLLTVRCFFLDLVLPIIMSFVVVWCPILRRPGAFIGTSFDGTRHHGVTANRQSHSGKSLRASRSRIDARTPPRNVVWIRRKPLQRFAAVVILKSALVCMDYIYSKF